MSGMSASASCRGSSSKYMRGSVGGGRGGSAWRRAEAARSSWITTKPAAALRRLRACETSAASPCSASSSASLTSLKADAMPVPFKARNVLRRTDSADVLTWRFSLTTL